jgi:hypothetical protein
VDKERKNGTELVENYDSGAYASTVRLRREAAISMAYRD